MGLRLQQIVPAGMAALLLMGPAFVAPVGAQVVPASPAALGMSGAYGSIARGFAALGANPANLAFADNPSWSLALPFLGARSGLDPITLGDISDYDGELIPESRKEAWLREIEQAGGQTGSGRLELTALALSVGRFALQVHTQGFADANLNPAAAELLLYGNAGRTGQPGDYDLEGAEATGGALTTLSAGYGFPVSRRVNLGLAVNYTVGNGVALARDAGSLVRSDPISVDVAFPILQTDDEAYDLDGGSGFGLDVGGTWADGRWIVGMKVANLVHTFEWDLESLVYRPGELVFEEGVSRSDTEKRPADQAPQALLDALDDLRFRPRIHVSTAYALHPDLTLGAEFVQRLGEGLPVGPETQLSAGLDWTPNGFVALQAGGAVVSEGFRMGLGSVFTLGPANLSAAWQFQTGDVGQGTLVALGISFLAR